MRFSIFPALLAMLAVAGPTSPTSAESQVYTVGLPAGEAVSYVLELDVRHAGGLAVEAEWSADRRVSLRLESPLPGRPSLHSAGESPRRLHTEVEPRAVGRGPWKVMIHVPAGREAGEGLLTVELPDPPAPPPPPADFPPRVEPAPPLERELPGWALPREAPPGAAPALRRLFDEVEAFRAVAAVAAAESTDTCRWQADLLRYLAGWRDRLAAGEAPPAQPTARLLDGITVLLGRIDHLRTTADPVLAGPPPADPLLREAWTRVRGEWIRDVEYRLDALSETILRGYAPDLSGEDWPLRLVSCLTACERHFEQRVRVGDERAANRELARDQWDRLLLAGRALESLTALSPAGR